MLIQALQTAGFGNLPDDRFEFSSGLTVVKGPNEAGKSFMMRAVTEALFGDGTSTAGDIRDRCRKWGCDGAFFVRLELEHQGETFVLTRDYGSGANTLETPDGSILKDKKKITSWVASVTGLPSATSFRATACIQQEDVEAVGEVSASLRSIIEGRLAGSGSEVDVLIKRLTKKKEEILSRSGAKGMLAEQRSLLAALSDELAAARSRVAGLATNKKDLALTRKELAEKSLALKDTIKAHEGSTKYISAMKDRDEASSAFDRASDSLERCKAAKKAILESEQELERLAGERTALTAEVEKADEFNRADSRKAELEKQMAALEKRIGSIEEVDLSIQDKRSRLDSIVKVDPVELNNAIRLPGEIAGLEAALSEFLFGVEVEAGEGVAYSVTADGSAVEGPAARAHAEASVDFPGLATVRFTNLTGETGPVTEEVERKKAVLADLLASYGTRDVAELEHLSSERKEAERELASIVERRSALLEGEGLEELRAAASEMKQDLDSQLELADALRVYALTPETLLLKRGEMERCEKDVRAQEEAGSRGRGVLETVGDDEEALYREMKDAAKVLAVAEAALEALKVYECTPLDFERQKRQMDDLAIQVEELKKTEMQLSVRIDEEDMGEEDIAALEEKLELAASRVQRLEREHEVTRLIVENIETARGDSISRFSQGIEQRMGELLSGLTNGRYTRVGVDGELCVTVYSPDKGEFVEVEGRQRALLSSGTIDQVHLAARLALLELISGDARPPVIMDDTFVSFDDMGRKDRAFALMQSFAGEYQVLYFTCHNCPDDLEKLEVRA